MSLCLEAIRVVPSCVVWDAHKDLRDKLVGLHND